MRQFLIGKAVWLAIVGLLLTGIVNESAGLVNIAAVAVWVTMSLGLFAVVMIVCAISLSGSGDERAIKLMRSMDGSQSGVVRWSVNALCSIITATLLAYAGLIVTAVMYSLITLVIISVISSNNEALNKIDEAGMVEK